MPVTKPDPRVQKRAAATKRVQQAQEADRVQRAKANEPKWDQFGTYAELAGELARRVGADPGVVYDEFAERSAVAFYGGGISLEQAEEQAWRHTLERFEKQLSLTEAA